MNKEYIYIDGKAIIKDEKGNQKPIEYYDNLDEVLIQENLIETMENKIIDLEQSKKDYNKNHKKHYIPKILPTSVITIIGFPVVMYLLGSILGIDINTEINNTRLGTMSILDTFTISTSLVILPLTTIWEFANYICYKNEEKQEKGINNELEFLKKEIVNQRKKLVDLKKDKTRTKENNEFRVEKVNDLEKLKSYKSYLTLCYDLGYNEKKYYRYYQQGKLEEKLSKYYTSNGIETAKEYLEEKGPTLVKRKK